MPVYTTVWEFQARPESEAKFEQYYAAEGEWVKLFRRAPGYVETRLLKDRAMPGRYLTIDRWESEESFQAFRAQFAREYEELDRHCEALTQRERAIGVFSE
jgi:heme-degrading monooxygenase HmoA